MDLSFTALIDQFMIKKINQIVSLEKNNNVLLFCLFH